VSLEEPGLLKVEDLRVYYKTRSNPVRAVDGVSFSIKQGEILGIVGESGCGKSTLANAVLRLIEPPAYINGGQVFFKDLNLLNIDEEKLNKIRWKEISLIPQSAMNALNPVMKIYHQIKEVITDKKIKFSDKEIKEKSEEIMKRLMLPSYILNAYPCQLSGGMRQRALLLLSFILNPNLVIADEPTSAVDVVTQRKILEFLDMQRKDFGTSIILITHDIAIVAEVADRIMVMYAGKTLEMGDVTKIFENPLHPYTKTLMESIPILGVKREVIGLSGLPPDLRNPPTGCRFNPRCRYSRSTDICKLKEPELRYVENNHLVACHMYS
jgi:peptide/nickel transport system ATP-binding protein